MTRQVPDWCSTTSLDPELLAYAYVDYPWLKPESLDRAGQLLAQRGEILRAVYGSDSGGNAAAEGFVSTVAPASSMRLSQNENIVQGSIERILVTSIRFGR